jgi:hypothetical protein
MTISSFVVSPPLVPGTNFLDGGDLSSIDTAGNDIRRPPALREGAIVAAMDPVITVNGPHRDRLVVLPDAEDRPATTVFASRRLARHLPWSSSHCLAASSATLNNQFQEPSASFSEKLVADEFIIFGHK